MADHVKTAPPEPAKASSKHESVKTSSNIEVHPLYTPADLQDWQYDQQLGYPGQFPFTRGVHPTMYRGRLWINRLARTAVVWPRMGSLFVRIARIHPSILRLLTSKIVSPNL